MCQSSDPRRASSEIIPAATALCGAGYGERSATRVNSPNGYREREWNSRVVTMKLAIPKLRQGSYFLAWLLAPRREILGLEVVTAEEGAAWLALLSRRVARGTSSS